MHVARTALLLALPALVAFACTREGALSPETTSHQGGSGAVGAHGGAGAQGGAAAHGGYAGAGAQGAGGSSNVCVLDESNLDECVLGL